MVIFPWFFVGLPGRVIHLFLADEAFTFTQGKLEPPWDDQTRLANPPPKMQAFCWEVHLHCRMMIFQAFSKSFLRYVPGKSSAILVPYYHITILLNQGLPYY